MEKDYTVYLNTCVCHHHPSASLVLMQFYYFVLQPSTLKVIGPLVHSMTPGAVSVCYAALTLAGNMHKCALDIFIFCCWYCNIYHVYYVVLWSGDLQRKLTLNTEEAWSLQYWNRSNKPVGVPCVVGSQTYTLYCVRSDDNAVIMNVCWQWILSYCKWWMNEWMN